MLLLLLLHIRLVVIVLKPEVCVVLSFFSDCVVCAL